MRKNCYGVGKSLFTDIEARFDSRALSNAFMMVFKVHFFPTALLLPKWNTSVEEFRMFVYCPT